MAWDWIRNWFKFQRHDDAYARDRKKLGNAIVASIVRQQELNRVIWIVIHSQAVYRDTQALLDENRFDYSVVTHPMEAGKIMQAGAAHPLLQNDSIHLIHASLIPEPYSGNDKFSFDNSVSAFVLDRSADIKDDERVISFCKKLPIRFELGYFLALDDELVKRVLNETSMMVLQQLGLDQHDLITSNLITSRLDRLLRREAKDRETPGHEDSA